MVFNRKLFLSAILISLAALTYINYDLISKNGYRDRLPSILLKANLNQRQWGPKINGEGCHARVKDFCFISNGDQLTSIFLIGDSHLTSISGELINKAKDKFNVGLANNGGCPFVLNVKKLPTDLCTPSNNRKRFDFILSKENSIVIIGGRYPLYLNGDGFNNKEGGYEGSKNMSFSSLTNNSFEQEFTKTVKGLIDANYQIILLYPIPEVGIDVPSFIYKQNQTKFLNYLTTSYEVYKERSASTFELFDSIESPNIHRVYPHTLFCDKQIKGRCVTHNKEDVFYADDDHPSAKGSEMIVELIMEQINNAEANIRGN